MIDSHAHLTDERFDAKQIIADMPSDGLKKIITVGYDIKSSEECVSLAEANADVYAAVGVHPADADKVDDAQLRRLAELLDREKTVALGEIGLDYFYEDNPPREVQRRALIMQLQLAEQSGLPTVFHLRDAYPDMEKIISENLSKLKGGAVMHCFSGSLETMRFYAERGFYISFSGSITFKNAVKFPEIIRAVPRDRLLIETDCPYLTPHPFRGQLNYPRYVRYQAMKIAEILGESVEEIERITEENAFSLFTKMRR